MMFNKKKYNKQYCIENKEQIKEYKEQYHLEHKKQILEHKKQYYIKNKEEKLKYAIQYQKDNLEYIKEYKKKYYQTEVGKATTRKKNNKRRQLGFTPLNEPFSDCEGHHISENFVVYIPRKIHKYLYHSIWNWKNMDKINKLAISFL